MFPFTPFLGQWSIYDPETAPEHTEEKRNVFRRVRDEIRAKVGNFISEANKQKPGYRKTGEGEVAVGLSTWTILLGEFSMIPIQAAAN